MRKHQKDSRVARHFITRQYQVIILVTKDWLPDKPRTTLRVTIYYTLTFSYQVYNLLSFNNMGEVSELLELRLPQADANLLHAVSHRAAADQLRGPTGQLRGAAAAATNKDGPGQQPPEDGRRRRRPRGRRVVPPGGVDPGPTRSARAQAGLRADEGRGVPRRRRFRVAATRITCAAAVVRQPSGRARGQLPRRGSVFVEFEPRDARFAG